MRRLWRWPVHVLGPVSLDLFYFRPFGSYGYYGKGQERRDPTKMGFLESVFSYAFGDDNQIKVWKKNN
jgi:hypothetical protein